MKLIFTILLFVSFSLTSSAQVFADFEMPQDTFYNGSDQSGGFNFSVNIGGGSSSTIDFSFSNVYNPDFGGYWQSGWAMSTIDDTNTSGPGNLYASKAPITDLVYEKYAVGQQNSGVKLSGYPSSFAGLTITNTTYAHNSIRDGDMFATAFGGMDGNDPDFFLLTIFGYEGGQKIESDSVEFYLADYRFADNSQDYIVDSWTNIPLSSTGFSYADSISFHLTSSDTSAGFFNTPLFFCLGEIDVVYLSTSEVEKAAAKVKLTPNPTADILNIDFEEIQSALTLDILDARGAKVFSKNLRYQDRDQIDVSTLPPGVYFLHVRGEVSFAKKFIKK
ncbi:MAG: DUF4465 domain-containing protein [Saprospiraceae bacterium]